MFGFGLKLKSKPKPTISVARRPRDLIGETSQKTDAIGPIDNSKQTDENINKAQNSKSDKPEEFDGSERSIPTVVNNCLESLAYSASGHLEHDNIDSKKVGETSSKTGPLNSPSVVALKNSSICVINNDRTSSHSISDVNCVIQNNVEQNIPTTPVSTVKEVLSTVDNAIKETCSQLENSVVLKDVNTVDGSSENANQDSNRQKSAPFKPKLLPKKNKFVPNVRAVRRTDDQSNKSILNSPQKNTDSIKNDNDDTTVLDFVCESHDDSDDITSKNAELLSEKPRTVTGNELQNQSKAGEQPQGKEPPLAQPIQSPHQINSHKEPVSSSKPISENSADKENTVCNDDSQMQNPGNILQNCKKKKPRAQGTFLQMTIEAKKELNEKLKDGVLDKSKLIMRDLILYNPTSNPMPVKSRSKGIKDEKKCKSECKSIVDEILTEQSVDDVEATRDSEAGSMPVPKLKVGPDGKIVLDSSSLVIETTGTEKSRTNLQNSELVEENEFSGFKYRKRRARRNDWSAEETVLFYKALNDLGADFSLMQSLFPSRTRRDLKLKFKKEERCNLSLVDKAMTHVGKFNFDALKEELTRDRAERTRRQEEQTRIKEEAKKMLKLQKLEAKNRERKIKAEKVNKLKNEQCNLKQNEKNNSKKGVKRNKKMSATEGCKPKKIKSEKKMKLDSDSDGGKPLYSFDKSMDSCNDDMRYDTMFKTTKSGRRPRIKNKIKEECERNKIKDALRSKKAIDILREQLESVNNIDIDVETAEEQLGSVVLDSTQEIKICLFEDYSNLAKTDELEETSDLQIEEVVEEQNNESNDETSISNIGSSLQIQNSLKSLKIVEELTSGILHDTVDVNGVMCKIIALNDDNECGSSTFQVSDSQENNSTNSNCCIRLETVSDVVESDCQQLNYVISYAENEHNDEIVEIPSQLVTDTKTNSNLPPGSDHSYCIAKSPDDDDNTSNFSNSQPADRSFVVLKPNECLKIYNDS